MEHKEILKVFRMPIRTDIVVVHWRIIDKRIRKILMAPITEEQERILDEGNFIDVITTNKAYVLNNKDAIAYGVIDFSEGSDDMEIIRSCEWCIEDYFKGVCIPAKYDYKNHKAIANRAGVLYYDTCRSDLILKYKHGCLNKPERVIIWREYSKKR